MKAPLKLSLADYLPYLVDRVGSIIADQFSTETLAPHRLSVATWRVLAVLAANGRQRQTDLAELTSIDASTLSRIVSRLMHLGLVTRTRSVTSNREVAVALSRKAARWSHASFRPPANRSGCQRGNFARRAGGGETLSAPDVCQPDEQVDDVAKRAATTRRRLKIIRRSFPAPCPRTPKSPVACRQSRVRSNAPRRDRRYSCRAWCAARTS